METRPEHVVGVARGLAAGRASVEMAAAEPMAVRIIIAALNQFLVSGVVCM